MNILEAKKLLIKGNYIYRESNLNKKYNLANMYVDTLLMQDVIAEDWKVQFEPGQLMFLMEIIDKEKEYGRRFYTRLDWKEKKFIKKSIRKPDIYLAYKSPNEAHILSGYVPSQKDFLTKDWYEFII
jgi:hypothetical protein